MHKSQTFELSGVGLINLERSNRAKYISISVRLSGTIRVAVPMGVTFVEAEALARTKEQWIRRSLLKVRMRGQAQKEFIEKFPDIDRKAATIQLLERLQELASEHGFKYKRATIRNQKTRWGSCSFDNNISLNIKLILLPDDLRDFIIVHELVHTREKNHGAGFWQLLTELIPDARARAKEVKKFSTRLC